MYILNLGNLLPDNVMALLVTPIIWFMLVYTNNILGMTSNLLFFIFRYYIKQRV